MTLCNHIIKKKEREGVTLLCANEVMKSAPKISPSNINKNKQEESYHQRKNRYIKIFKILSGESGYFVTRLSSEKSLRMIS